MKPHKNRQDLTGQKFGKLKVISLFGSVNGRVKWNCLCECGKTLSVYANNLKRSKSCGCMQKQNIFESLKIQIYNSYRCGAKKRDISFTLTFHQFECLLFKNCSYCDGKPENKKTRYQTTLLYNGIDRIDSRKGYEVDNVTTACWKCNSMKKEMSFSEFANHIDTLYKFLNKKEDT